MINSDFRKKMADSWFSYLQNQICKEFETLEDNNYKFSRRDWKKEKEKLKTQTTPSILKMTMTSKKKGR